MLGQNFDHYEDDPMKELRDLSFTKTLNSGHVRAWKPYSISDWASMTAQGRCRADELVDYMRETGNFSALPSVVKCFPSEIGSVEIAFLTRIAERSTMTGAVELAFKPQLATGRPGA